MTERKRSWTRRTLLGGGLTVVLVSFSKALRAKITGASSTAQKGESVMSATDRARENFVYVNQAPAPAPELVQGPFTKATMDYVFETVWSQKRLSWREKRLISLCCTAIPASVTAMLTASQLTVWSSRLTCAA